MLEIQVWIQGADNRVLLLWAPFQASPHKAPGSASAAHLLFMLQPSILLFIYLFVYFASDWAASNLLLSY